MRVLVARGQELGTGAAILARYYKYMARKAGAAKNNRWDEKAGRQEIWQCDSPLCDGEPKEYQLWYQEGSDVIGKCVPCVLEDHPSQQRTIKNLLLQVDQTRPGVLNKMQMKVTKKNSSTSGAKVTKQEFSKWMMSRRR